MKRPALTGAATARRTARRLAEYWRRWRAGPVRRQPAPGEFRCNICGVVNRVAGSSDPERPTCRVCRSNVRYRTIVHLLTRDLTGESLVLADVSRRWPQTGLGMSDAWCYADRLARLFAYTNTFLHAPPYLDITRVPPALEGSADFLISSEVFEHVPPPVQRAFDNACLLLRPNGLLVLTVPFVLAADRAETLEHFPELNDFRLVRTATGHELHNQTRDGREQVVRDLIFHGGPGSTLEMRVFTREALEGHLRAAGFREIEFQRPRVPEYGIAWPTDYSLPVTARR